MLTEQKNSRPAFSSVWRLAFCLLCLGFPVSAQQALSVPLTSVSTHIAPQDPSLDHAYGALGRALVATENGSPQKARHYLRSAIEALGKTSTTLKAQKEFGLLKDELETLVTRPALGSADIQAVMGAFGRLENSTEGQKTSLLGAWSAMTARLFTSPLRAVLQVLLGVLSVLPLWMLGRAFGWQTPAWRFVLLGLAFLLLPMMLSGVGSLLALVSLATLPLLGAGVFGLWPVGFLMNVAGVLFLSLGAYEICVQFGVFPNRSRKTSVPRSQRLNETDPRLTSIDWDEDD